MSENTDVKQIDMACVNKNYIFNKVNYFDNFMYIKVKIFSCKHKILSKISKVKYINELNVPF